MAPRNAIKAAVLARATSVLLALSGCSEQLDAGASHPRGLLPVDERSPVILVNDGAYDNWDGEYAMLLANGGGAALSAIIVNTSPTWSDIGANVTGWRALVAAARASGLRNIPDPTTSIATPLVMPSSGKIEDTQPNRSEGARLIVELSAQLAFPYRPVAVATGGNLTDVADAYLIDPGVADRVVVIASLGALEASGAAMVGPNGNLDPWADVIVATRFRYVQVSAYYDEIDDVPDSRLADLPANPFGDWMRAKQPKIYQTPIASDQVALLAASLSGFAVSVQSVSAALPFDSSSGNGPDLTVDPAGKDLVVNNSSGPLATAKLWQLLLDPATFSQ